MQTLTAGGGLNNLGNTCFFNATLQSLLHTPPLARLFQNHTHSQACDRKQWCVFCEMESIYSKTRQAKSFSPNIMINNLKKIFKKFKLGRQEDSHQFLRYLVEGMQDSETGKLGKDRKENEQKIKKTKVFDVFGGVIKTCVQCLNCHHKSITDERYYDFNISQECQRANSLLDGISSFFTIDKLEGANKYLCQNCKVRSNARKRFLLESIPQVATFQLKRFTNNMRKIGKFIQYPLEIDLGKYLQNPRKVTLKLFAIIVHAGGSSFSGHYYAFVRVGNSWFKMDDNYVSKCSYESAIGQNAYILFYEKQEHTEIKQNGYLKKEINKIEIEILNKGDLKIKEVKEITQKHVIEQKKQEKKAMEVQESVHVNGFNKNHINGDKENGNNKQSNHLPHKQKHNQSLAAKDFAEIQHILIEKLISADAFKAINQQNNHINEAIQKAVKQAMHEVTPKKAAEQSKQEQQHQQLQQLSIPSLQRRKSKEQMQRQIPYSQLILRTFQKILNLKSKMPNHKPHNFSQRSMYNLRKYETTMQKKRKLG